MYVEFMVGVLMTKLKDVFSLQITGEWGIEYTENETNTKVLRTTNFTPDGIINYSDVVLRCIHKDKVEKKKLRYGDIILEKSGGTEKTPVGRVVFCDESIEQDTYLCNNFTQAMRVNREIAVPKYVFYFMWNLHNSGKTELLQNKTTGIRNLQVKSYLNEEIPLPPLAEQRKIAAVLDKVSDLIAKRRQQLDKLDELVKAMFGDPVENPHGFMVVSLENLIDKGIITYHLDGNHGGDYPRSGEFISEGVPYIGANCIVDGRIDFSLAKYLSQERASKLRKGIAKNGDVLFAHNATVGPVVVLETREPKVILSTSLTAYRCNLNQINPYYLCSYMKSRGFVMQYSSEMKQTTRNQVPITAQKKYLFLIPPLELQNQFSTFVQQTEKNKTIVGCSLNTLETLKKTLMQKYFR